MSFTLPNLNNFVQWFKSRIKPEDPQIGSGISDWTITAEYVPNLEVGGAKAFGALCSPSDPTLMITPEDVASKRAHFLICTPENERDIQEMYETFRHECEHILQSMYAKLGESTRAAMENHAHSMGNFIAQLTPEEILLFPRWKLTPMARAYRAKDKAMPDPTQDENKDKPDKQAPAMQEGAPRDIAAISADIANADPTDTAKLAALAIEYRQALVAKATEAMAGNGPASTPEPPMMPPTMGMKPEDAYARARTEWTKERTEAIEAIIEANPHLDDKQKAMARKQGTVAAARELIATYPRVANQNEPPRMGMPTNPKTDPSGKQSPFARMRQGPSDPMVREAIGLPSTAPNEHGVGTAPAHVLTFSFAENARNYQDKYRAKMRAQREAVQ